MPASWLKAALSALAFIALAAGAADSWIVGQVTSLSGTNGPELGRGLALGQQVYFDHVNATGGVHGKPIRLVTLDDGYRDSETVRLTRSLLETRQPIALLGYRGTANTLALMHSRLLGQEGIALVGTLTGAEGVQGAENIFHVRTPYAVEVAALVEQVLGLGYRSIALVHADDAFGKAGLDAARAALGKNGAVIDAFAYRSDAAAFKSSVETVSRALARARHDAVILVAVGEPAFEFIRVHRLAQPYSPIFAMSVVSYQEVLDRVGMKAAQGIGFSQVFPFPYSDSVPLVREYRKLLKQYAPSAKPDYFSLEGYVNAKVFVQALRRAGPKADRAGVLKALNEAGELDLGGFYVRLGPRWRTGSSFTELTVLSKSGNLIR
ncbi:ABC transporter substrate-binding protein [Noviherbaspirillum galbum]|uniref:ABC transporter substrate-binding protein n=1 Tax=Noviherbaspirillum galbum TaxID=2709383 RepID=A0A6B3SMT2_9BURK|nr:ABC transporter substrate-binding protein [Noviherbaspirillum galbum]NEX61788.1 ABC transporter substrate-binding protein [Noviherbaspirillum galbum]